MRLARFVLKILIMQLSFFSSIFGIELDQASPLRDPHLTHDSYCSDLIAEYNEELNAAELIAMNLMTRQDLDLSCGTEKFEATETAKVTVRRNSPPGASYLLGDPWLVAFSDAHREGHLKACDAAKEKARKKLKEMSCPDDCGTMVIKWGRCSPSGFSEEGVYPKKADKPWRKVRDWEPLFGETWEVTLSVTRSIEVSVTCREPSWWRDLLRCDGTPTQQGEEAIISSESQL